ncbi:MAG: MOSC domain-containing protein [Planctomycetota bacterium]|nr:MOSC domain-containing protein [Planctomycetota bacterium]
MKDLLNSFPHVGKVVWLGIRPERRAEVEVAQQIRLDVEHGVLGDHFQGASESARQVTLLQYEHLAVVAELMQQEKIDPADLRRNIVVSGINLQALKNQEFEMGGALLLGTGNCPPCSRMEENLGPGGYNAMRGHGGITARVLQPGDVSVGCEVRWRSPEST